VTARPYSGLLRLCFRPVTQTLRHRAVTESVSGMCATWDIPFVGNGSLSFSTPNLQYLDLSRNGLNTIESNAFQGISLIYLFLLSFKSLFSLHHCKTNLFY
jgi:hypothetical protein